MTIIAVFSQMLVPFITFLVTIGLTWAVALAFFKVLKNSGGDKSSSSKSAMVDTAYSFLTREKLMSTLYLSPDLARAESQVISNLYVLGDTDSSINQRFAVLTGLVREGEALPNYYQHLITKRVLFEYYSRYGDLKQRYLNVNKLKVTECLTPIEGDRKLAFDQFCLANNA